MKNGTDINYISFENQFWIKWNANCVNFGWNSLPSDVHFTIAFNAGTPDLNLHITRNTSDTDKKPKETLFVIDKKLLSKIVESYANYFVAKVFSQIDINQILSEYPEAVFLPFDESVQNGFLGKLRIYLAPAVKKTWKIKKKTQVKFSEHLEDTLQQVLSANDLTELIEESITDIPDENGTATKAGLLLFNNDCSMMVIRHQNLWYKLTQLKMEDLYIIIEPNLRKRIPFLIKRAIIKVKRASELKEQHPIRLTLLQ